MDRHPTAPAESLSVQVVADTLAWDQLRDEWARLFAASPTATPVLHWDWLRTWWDVYAGPADQLRILALRRGTALIGVLPLYARRQGMPGCTVCRLRFLSTGEAEWEETCPDYLDLLRAPGEQMGCRQALALALADRRQLRWDDLDLDYLTETSPLFDPAAIVPGRCVVQSTPGERSWEANLAGGFTRYLEQLSSCNRQQARRVLRAAQRAGAVLELARDPVEAEEYYNELIRLHQQRWTAEGQPGCFAAPRFAEFHRRLTQKWVPRGQAVLARLACAGRVLAVLYGFRNRTRFAFYQGGMTVEAGRPFASPGIAAHLLLMQRLADDDITAYDFLRGWSAYKERLATTEMPRYRVRIVRAGIAQRLWHSAELLSRAARKMLRCARGALPRHLYRQMAPAGTAASRSDGIDLK